MKKEKSAEKRMETQTGTLLQSILDFKDPESRDHVHKFYNVIARKIVHAQ